MKKLLLLFSFILTIHFTFADYDPLQGLEYAYASSLSYCNPPHIQSWECGQACQNLTGYQPYYTYLVQVATAQSLSFSMIYNPSSKRFVTAFRGTVGNIELLSEILEDTPVDYELSNITDAKVLKYFYNHYTGLRANFTQKLQEFYAANPDYNFIFTGHSLGAALSTLAAFDTVTSGSIPADKVSLYNYGSPRVGNYAFAQAVKAAIPVIYRTTHWNDLVPHVPPCVTNSSGNCVPSSLDAEEMQESGILWPAWHISPEVFYDKASYNYKICVESEDQNCTDQFKLLGTNMLEHYHYMNVSMECDGNMAVQSFASLGEKATEEMLFETMFIRW